jgi:hypothetical protein
VCDPCALNSPTLEDERDSNLFIYRTTAKQNMRNSFEPESEAQCLSARSGTREPYDWTDKLEAHIRFLVRTGSKGAREGGGRRENSYSPLIAGVIGRAAQGVLLIPGRPINEDTVFFFQFSTVDYDF